MQGYRTARIRLPADPAARPWMISRYPPSLPLLVRLSEWRRVVAAYGLWIEFAGHLDGGLADIDERAAAFLHEGSRTFVEALGQFTNGLYLLEQFVAIAAGKAGQDVIDFAHGAVDGDEGAVGLAKDAVDRVAPACKRGRIGLETQHRVFQLRLIADQDSVDIVQGVADRLHLAQVGGQDRNSVLVHRHRRRRRGAARQRYRRHARQPLEFQTHHGVLADRGAAI